jgi:HJR/Mrr/RecB family endonuclease
MFLTRTVLLHSWLLAFISLDGLYIMVSIYIYMVGGWFQHSSEKYDESQLG